MRQTSDDTRTVHDIVSTIWQQRKYAVAGIVVGFALALLFAMQFKPKYISETEIVVDLRGLAVTNNELVPVAQDTILSTLVNTEISILKSDTVLRNVVSELDLQDDPEFTGQSAFNRLFSSLKSIFGAQRSTGDLQARATGVLRRNIVIGRKKDTLVLTIDTSSQNPAKSQALNRSILKHYFAMRVSNQKTSTFRITAALEAHLETQTQKVAEADRQIEEYKVANNIHNAEGRLNNELQITTLTNQLSSVRLEISNLQARHDQIQDVINSGSIPDDLAGIFQSSVIIGLRNRLLALEDRKSVLTANFGNRHPELKVAVAQIRALKRSIREEIVKEFGTVERNLDRVMVTENSLQKQLVALQNRTSEINLSQVTLHQLERDAETSRSVYIATLTRLREIKTLQGVDNSNVRVISEPTMPIDNARISKKLILFIGGMLGLSVGAFVGFVSPSVSNRICSANHLMSVTGLPVLARFSASDGPIMLEQNQAWSAPKLFDKMQDDEQSVLSLDKLSHHLQHSAPLNDDDRHWSEVVLFLSLDSSVSTALYTANLAALGLSNKDRILLVDGKASPNNFQNLRLQLSARNRGVSDITQIGQANQTKISYYRTDDRFYSYGNSAHMDESFADSRNDAAQKSFSHMTNHIAELSTVHDLTIIDGGQINLQKYLREFVHVATKIILVVQEQETKLDAFDDAHKLLGGATTKVVGCVYLTPPRLKSEVLPSLSTSDLPLFKLQSNDNALMTDGWSEIAE